MFRQYTYMQSALTGSYKAFHHNGNVLSIISDSSGWRELALQCMASEDLDFSSTRRHESYMKVSHFAFFLIHIYTRLTALVPCTSE